jgi:hypothetical protein
MTINEVFLTKRQQAERYSKTTRTIDRWRKNRGLNYPKQYDINGKPHSKLSEHETWERSLPAALAAERDWDRERELAGAGAEINSNT